jgi:hypothetical protein
MFRDVIVRLRSPGATAAGIADGHHFPFNDDPDAYSAAISTWWTARVAATA